MITVLVACSGFQAGSVLAQAPAADPDMSETREPAQTESLATPDREARLDDLFSQLRRESDPEAARRIVGQIWAAWNDSGSDTVDTLMGWANQAMTDKRYGTALDLLDQVIVLAPDYSEGWNRRATLHYIMNDHAKSMADIQRVLVLEPRHFGALAGMAAIFTAAGDDRLALQALQRMLVIYPADRNTQSRVLALEDKLAADNI